MVDRLDHGDLLFHPTLYKFVLYTSSCISEEEKPTIAILSKSVHKMKTNFCRIHLTKHKMRKSDNAIESALEARENVGKKLW